MDKGAKINDKFSYNEPIVNALKIRNKQMVETLFEHGANALNTKYLVLASYITAGFFNIEIMKKLNRAWNPLLGCPLQVVIREKQMEAARLIFDDADNEMKIQLSRNKNENGMIPLSLAICCSNEEFIRKLAFKCYNITTPDNEGIKPFIHACDHNNEEAMEGILGIIDLDSANMKDKNGCSALTYAANNNNVKFCDMLFCNNINAFGIKADQNGTIERYSNLLDKYE